MIQETTDPSKISNPYIFMFIARFKMVQNVKSKLHPLTRKGLFADIEYILDYIFIFNW